MCGLKSALSSHSSRFTVTCRSVFHAATIAVSVKVAGGNSPVFISIILEWFCMSLTIQSFLISILFSRTIFYHTGFIWLNA